MLKSDLKSTSDGFTGGAGGGGGGCAPPSPGQRGCRGGEGAIFYDKAKKTK